MAIKNLKSLLFTFCLIILCTSTTQAQFSFYDSALGSDGLYRQKWNVLHYEIFVEPDINSKTISGYNNITFFDNGAQLMQIDLKQPMQVDKIEGKFGDINFRRDSNIVWVMLRDTAAKFKINPDTNFIKIYFSGKPKIARNPPWDGGWVWKKDAYKNPWISVACQGEGGSLWYPCKDANFDKPELGATLKIKVPDSLEAVGNGRLANVTFDSAGKKTFTWVVTAPISTYNIVPYIGKYVPIEDVYTGEKGTLTLDYRILYYNKDKAAKHFTQVKEMLKAFEFWFGPYPFYADGYKLVEAPFLGMEHQSAIAYGNNFKQGYYGTDLSKSGWGLKWDFIIIHESGHEWFGNSISYRDVADMWINEGFTNYSEVLFTDYYYGLNAGNEYLIGLKNNIKNDIPVTGVYGVHNEGSDDMYYKAAAMIHIIRQLVNNDDKFRKMLREMNKKFYHSSVSAAEIENFIISYTGLKISKVFEQYLHTVKVPELNVKINKKHLYYKWSNCVEGFNMPVKIITSQGKKILLHPSEKIKRIKISGNSITVVKNFYVTLTFN